MFECCGNPVHLCLFPTELLNYIFNFLSAKNLMLCRQVCRRWKEVIDLICSDDNMWKIYCEKDYKKVYKEAKLKSDSCRLWFDIYRSLTLWGRFSDATEFRDEFSHSSVSADEIQGIGVLKDGKIFIQKRGAVVYYNISTLEMIERNSIVGTFLKFVDYDDAFIILGSYLHLQIIKKPKIQQNLCNSDSRNDIIMHGVERSTFYNTKKFLCDGRNIYFVNNLNDIFYCNIDEKLTATLLTHNYTDFVYSLSCYNEHLHMLSLKCNVYSYQNNAFVKLFNLESKKSNIFDCLFQYQFLENINWQIFYLLAARLRIKIPQGPLQFISTIKIYGDVFFIGCENGMLLIYYKPYVDGQLDFFNSNPVKQYRFNDRDDLPVFSLHPILMVEIVEIKGGHKIFVAMQKKVIVVTYKHNSEVETSEAVLPYVPPGPIVLKT